MTKKEITIRLSSGLEARPLESRMVISFLVIIVSLLVLP